jgi:RHS repeat-associated protein
MGTSIINTEYFGGFQYSTPNTDPLRKALNAKDDATMELTRAGEEEAFTKDLERAIVVDPGNPSADNMVLSFFPTSEGYYDFENLRYIYQYKDQVGNIRVSYTKDPSTGLAKSLDQNDYYPFGMSHLKSVPSLYDPMSVPYNYKFGGKELQETGFYDFGARMLMPDLGRWFAIDPLAELSPDLTPFRYAFNNPISYTDPNGMYEDDGGPGDEWANKGYDAFFERHGDYGGDNFAADFQADLSAEYQEEMQDGMEGPDKRKQRDIEDAKENAYLDQQLAREKADVRSHGIEVGCCPNPVITLGEIAAEGTTSFSRAGVIGVTWYVVNGLFGSAHIPADPMTVGIAYNNIKTLADIKDAVSSPAVKSRGNQIGSYTIIFNNNKKYHGKGPLPRMMLSAAQHSIANKVMVQSMQWTPSATDRQAFKDEYRRMQTDANEDFEEGYRNPINFNKIQSPGKLYMQQDGY